MSSPLTIHPETSTSLPSPPFIHLKGIANFRDLGGWPIANDASRSIRRHYIYRCAEPTKATEEAVAKIRSLGITHIYDLRATPEIKGFQVAMVPTEQDGNVASVESDYVGEDGAVNWPGVERVYCPVHPEASYDQASLALRHGDYMDGLEGKIRAYKKVLQEGTTAYTRIVRHILTHPPPSNAFIVHCTVGKDRTGVLCALLLSLCGVSDDIVAEEYALTEAGLGAWTETLVSSLMNWWKEVEEKDARSMIEAKKESMIGALDMLKRDFGGAEGYFRESCGLSGREIEMIKGYLIMDEPPLWGKPSQI